MTVPSWRNRLESASKANERRSRARKRRFKSCRSNIEQLETRQLLTFSATLTGSAATFTAGLGSGDGVTFTQAAGLLQHDTLTAPTGESFADDFDFDSTAANSQHLAASSGSTVTVQNLTYGAIIGTPASPASTLLAKFNLISDGDSTTTIDDSGSTTATTYTLSPSAITATGINVGLTGQFAPGVTLATSTAANDIVNVQGTNSPLTINTSAPDSVNVGNDGSLAGLLGSVYIKGTSYRFTGSV